MDFRRGQPALDPLPTQTEEAVLRQNIALSLTSAQIALLRREAVVYQRALDRVESSLDRYFDAQSVDVISALDTLGVLRRAPLSVDLPSVDHSLAALDEARRRLGEDP